MRRKQINVGVDSLTEERMSTRAKAVGASSMSAYVRSLIVRDVATSAVIQGPAPGPATMLETSADAALPAALAEYIQTEVRALEVRVRGIINAAQSATQAPPGVPADLWDKGTLDEIEKTVRRHALLTRLARLSGEVRAARASLQVSRSTWRRIMLDHQPGGYVPAPEKRPTNRRRARA